MYKTAQFVYKQLFGIPGYFRIFLEKQLSLLHFAFQPGVYLIDFPVQDNGIGNTQQKFQTNPQVIIARIIY